MTIVVIEHDPLNNNLSTLDEARTVRAGFMAQYRNLQTFKAYDTDLTHWWNWCASKQLPILQAQRPHLDMYVTWMQTHPAGWSESTIARRIGTVCGLYKWAAAEDYIPKDPGVRVVRPDVDQAKQRMTFLPPVEFATLIKYTGVHGTVMEKAYIAILGLRGLRIAEACSLNVESYGESGGYRTLSYVGKGNKFRRIVVPGPAVRPIENAIGGRTAGPILLNSEGRRLTRENGAYMIKHLAVRAGVDPDISNHSLRRSFVTAAKANGASYDDIAETVGHASTNTTKRYDRLSGSLDRDISHQVAGFLSNMAG